MTPTTSPVVHPRSGLRRWSRASKAWRKIHLFFGALNIIRFSLLIPVALGLATLSDQFTDLLRALAESDVSQTDNPHAAHRWAAAAMALFCSLIVWYSARTMFRFRFTSSEASHANVYPRLKKWLPRLLAVTVPGLLAARLWALRADSANPGGARRFAVYLMIEAILVGLFVWKRRDLAEWQPKADVRPLRLLATAYNDEKRDLTTLGDFHTRAPVTVNVVYALILANILGMIAFIWMPPLWLGAMSILLLGLGLMAALGTIVIYAANRARIPILTLLIFWAAAISAFNNNHLVRSYVGAHSHAVWSQAPEPPFHGGALPDASLDNYFIRWWADLDRSRPGNAPVPVIIVAAEGGGIRAAYWTAQVLARLQDQTAPNSFSRHVFAISGVSGGSLGAATFAASVRAHRDQATAATYQREAHDMLSADFLSAPLGAMLFPDLAQRFWPWPAFDDRAIALEQAWEREWQTIHAGRSNAFAKPFLNLWDTESFDVPLLFLNSTVVETGQRAIASPFAPTATTGPASPFADAQSVTALLGSDYALSTAVHLSARFTYVSPAGLIRTPLGDRPQVNLVDGGYFDNSGAITAEEILLRLEAVYQRLQATPGTRPAHPMLPVLLHIPNEPPNSVANTSWLHRFLTSHSLLNESMSPINALMATRQARGVQAREHLCRHLAAQSTVASSVDCADPRSADSGAAQLGRHVYFTLYRRGPSLPLGWALSRQAQEDMSRQLEKCDGDVPAGCTAVQATKVLKLLQNFYAKPSNAIPK